jgi:hypothetical protein
MRLSHRVADLEQRLASPGPKAWVRAFQYEGQTQEEAVAAYEAEHGPIDEKGVILRVFINKPFPAPAVA